MANGNMCALSALATKANTGADAIQRAPIVDYDSGVRCLRTSDISNNHRFTEWGFCSVTDKIFQQFQLKTNDLLIARTGPIGTPFFIERDLKAVFNNGIMRVRLDTSKCHPKYVFYALSADHFRQHVSSVGAGSATRPNIKMEVALNYSIFLPPLPVQRRIAGILSAYDKLMENSQRRIRLLEAMARALYREWFVHLRFPGHEKLPHVASSLGQIPKGWEVKKLGDILELNYGKALKKEERRDGQFPVFGSSGIVGHHDASLVSGPGIIVGRKGNVGSVFWCDENFFVIDTAYFVTSSLPLRFLFYVLPTLNFINSDAAVPGLSRKQADTLEMLVPPATLLESFCELADTFERQASTFQRQIQNLRRTRDLLLPRLLSGQVPIHVPDNETSVDTERELLLVRV